MATLYPGAIQTFPTMINISSTDAQYVKAYQEAMQNGDMQAAQNALSLISNSSLKLISANFLNTIDDTCVAIQLEYNKRYNPGITVSSTAPTSPQANDYWFEVI